MKHALQVDLIYDHPTGRSRGFGFVYFDKVEYATKARDKLNGAEVDGHKVRLGSEFKTSFLNFTIHAFISQFSFLSSCNVD